MTKANNFQDPRDLFDDSNREKFWCKNCGKFFSKKLWRLPLPPFDKMPACPHCKSTNTMYDPTIYH